MQTFNDAIVNIIILIQNLSLCRDKLHQCGNLGNI